MGAAYEPARHLFVAAGEPVVRVDMWSQRLQAWVFLVQTKTLQNPPGTHEVTPADIERIQSLIDDGWDEPTAIYRTLGVRPVT